MGCLCAPLFYYMARALEMKARLSALNISEMVSAIASDHKLMIADANRLRLEEGKNRDGEYLPRYIDDPYFKSIKQAKGYEAYKAKISPNKEKPRDVKDYYINGYTHRRITVDVTGTTINTGVATGWADHLEADKALGINPQSARELWNFAFQPLLCKDISGKTGIPYTEPPFAMK